jgi:hypothetical protein
MAIGTLMLYFPPLGIRNPVPLPVLKCRLHVLCFCLVFKRVDHRRFSGPSKLKEDTKVDPYAAVNSSHPTYALFWTHNKFDWALMRFAVQLLVERQYLSPESLAQSPLLDFLVNPGP